MRFITLEGIDGSGKSTQAKFLEEYLLERGRRVVLTEEPGWGKLGKIVKKTILKRRDIDLDPYAELCLFCADRAQHVRDFIMPNLKEGVTVVCDRYYDSTVAYQGFGRGLDLDLVSRMAEASTLGIKPDMTFFLSFPPEKALSRLREREKNSEKSDKIDEEPLEVHGRIAEGYAKISERNPSRIKLIDASLSCGEVRRQIESHLG